MPNGWDYSSDTALTVLTTVVGATVGLTGFVVTVTVLSPRLHHARRERFADRRSAGVAVEGVHEPAQHRRRPVAPRADLGRLRRRRRPPHRCEPLPPPLDVRGQVGDALERGIAGLIPFCGQPDRRLADPTDRSPAVAEAQEVEGNRLAVDCDLGRHPRTLIRRFRLITEAQVLERFPQGRLPVGARRRNGDRGLLAVGVAERDREPRGHTEARTEPRGHADGAGKPVEVKAERTRGLEHAVAKPVPGTVAGKLGPLERMRCHLDIAEKERAQLPVVRRPDPQLLAAQTGPAFRRCFTEADDRTRPFALPPPRRADRGGPAEPQAELIGTRGVRNVDRGALVRVAEHDRAQRVVGRPAEPCVAVGRLQRLAPLTIEPHGALDVQAPPGLERRAVAARTQNDGLAGAPDRRRLGDDPKQRPVGAEPEAGRRAGHGDPTCRLGVGRAKLIARPLAALLHRGGAGRRPRHRQLEVGVELEHGGRPLDRSGSAAAHPDPFHGVRVGRADPPGRRLERPVPEPPGFAVDAAGELEPVGMWPKLERPPTLEDEKRIDLSADAGHDLKPTPSGGDARLQAQEAADAAAALRAAVRQETELAVADRCVRVEGVLEHAVDRRAPVVVDLDEEAAHHHAATFDLRVDGHDSDDCTDFLREEAPVEPKSVGSPERLHRRKGHAGRGQANDAPQHLCALVEAPALHRLERCRAADLELGRRMPLEVVDPLGAKCQVRAVASLALGLHHADRRATECPPRRRPIRRASRRA